MTSSFLNQMISNIFKQTHEYNNLSVRLGAMLFYIGIIILIFICVSKYLISVLRRLVGHKIFHLGMFISIFNLLLEKFVKERWRPQVHVQWS